MSRAVTCRYHCTTCGSHFSSLSAFDGHREGDADSRHCIDPDDAVTRNGSSRLEVKTQTGRCNLARPGESAEPITVYTTYGAMDDADGHWAAA